MFSVEGLEVLIIGGSRGIGKALVSGFVKANARVTMFDVEAPSVIEGFDFIKCDLTLKNSIEKALLAYYQKNKIIKVLVNCAAITIPGESHKYSDEKWYNSISVNLSGVFFFVGKLEEE